MPSRKDFSQDDWDSAEGNLKKAERFSSMFFSLEDDGDSADVVFMQPPVYRQLKPYKDGDNPRTVGTCNVAVFEGGKFLKLMLADFARKHWKPFLRRIRKSGMNSLYVITRDGVRNDTQTVYDCEFLRELTSEENALLDDMELLAIRSDGSDSEENWLDQFRRTCGEEWERLGWDAEQGHKSIETLFGIFIGAADMDADQRMKYIAALSKLRKGDGPEKCDGQIDLDENGAF